MIRFDIAHLLKMLHRYVDMLWKSTSGPAFLNGYFGNSQTMLLCRRLRRWHGASFPSSFLRIGTSLRCWWRHVTSSRRRPLIVILNWFPCLIRCSVRSSGRLLIAHASVSLVPSHHFHGTWIYSCVSRRCDGVSRECEGFITVVFTETVPVR